MNIHEHPDDHIADHLEATFDTSRTTAGAHLKADQIIRDFETFRRHVTTGFTICGLLIGTALAADLACWITR